MAEFAVPEELLKRDTKTEHDKITMPGSGYGETSDHAGVKLLFQEAKWDSGSNGGSKSRPDSR